MKWTTEKPSKQGWYAWRDEHRYNINQWVWSYIIQMPNGDMGIYSPDGFALYPVKDVNHGEWAGPIPEPEEAE